MGLLFDILVPLAVGGVAAALTRNGMTVYAALEKPPLAPPPWVFPVVWTVLYVLMGLAFHRVRTAAADPAQKRRAGRWYALQLAVNFLWPLVFFGGQQFGAALAVLLLLIVLVAETLLAFWKIDRTAGLLLVPYLLWCCFAAYLNLAVWLRA